MKTCIKCNLTFEDEKKYCVNCGSPLSVVTKSVSKVDAKKFVFEERLKGDQLNVELLTEYATFLADNLEYDNSASILYKLLALNDNDCNAKRLLFKCLIGLKKLDEAIEIGDEILEKVGKDIALLEILAKLSNELNIEDKTIAYCNKIIEIDPDNVFALSNKAHIILNSNNIIDTLPIYSRLDLLGHKDRLILIYAGISNTLIGNFSLGIENFEEEFSIKKESINDIHNNRCLLYWTYCLCTQNIDLGKIEKKFQLIDFSILKNNYFESDEKIALKTISFIVDKKLNTIYDYNKHIIDELINSYIESTRFYFTDISNQSIAECWYNVALKQEEFSSNGDALISAQKALILMSTEKKYIEKEQEIQVLIQTNNDNRKRKNLIAISSIILIVAIGTSFLLLTFKHIENNIWSSLKSQNTIASFKDYLAEYPDGKYEKEAKLNIDSLLWEKAMSSNNYESYKLYADSSYYRLHAQEADSLEQLVIWHNAEVENSYEAYQRYIELFPNGKYSDKVNKIVDEKLWQKTKTQGTEADYKLYLKRFPEGKYAEKANGFLDENLWSSAESQNSLSAFENYKSNFPNGKYITEANSNIEYHQAIEKRKSDLSWLIGTWSVMTNYGYTSLKIHDSNNANNDGESGTYSVDGDVLTVHTSGGYGITYSIDYESMTLGLGGGYVMTKG